MKTQTLLSIAAIVVVMSPVTALCQKEIKSSYGEAVMYVNKDYAPHKYSKIMVITPTRDINGNKKIMKEVSKGGIPAIISTELLPPVKEYSEAEMKEIYKKNNVDGILKIVLKDKNSSNFMAISQNTFEFDVILTDLETNTNAVNFSGNTIFANNKSKAVLDFLKVIMDDLKQLM